MRESWRQTWRRKYCRIEGELEAGMDRENCRSEGELEAGRDRGNIVGLRESWRQAGMGEIK